MQLKNHKRFRELVLVTLTLVRLPPSEHMLHSLAPFHSLA